VLRYWTVSKSVDAYIVTASSAGFCSRSRLTTSVYGEQDTIARVLLRFHVTSVTNLGANEMSRITHSLDQCIPTFFHSCTP
jgi:hypothetical protein